jgi:hypothetical protein
MTTTSARRVHVRVSLAETDGPIHPASTLRVRWTSPMPPDRDDVESGTPVLANPAAQNRTEVPVAHTGHVYVWKAWSSQELLAAARSPGFGYENCVLDLKRESDSITDDAVHCQEIPAGLPAQHGERGMHIWTEFKNAILPWLLAGAVVAFLIAEHRRTTAALLDANTRLSNAVEQQGKALDGVRALLASQGYTLPPLSKPQ